MRIIKAVLNWEIHFLFSQFFVSLLAFETVSLQQISSLDELV